MRPCGLIASGFRPSDDACIYPFLIPSNLFAVRVLLDLGVMANQLGEREMERDALALAHQVREAIAQYGVAEHREFGKIYAYEVDGFGNRLFMDDANVPSLLSLPYLGAVEAGDSVYGNTRKFVLSEANPYFFQGKASVGNGGPHVGLGMIWPLAIIVRGLTATDPKEQRACLETLSEPMLGPGLCMNRSTRTIQRNSRGRGLRGPIRCLGNWC